MSQGRSLDSTPALTYMPAWQVAITPPKTRSGFNNPSPSARSESTAHVRAMYCAQCDASMPAGDVGVLCPACRAAVVLRP